VAGGAREYALSLDTASDIFAPKCRPELEATLQQLPDETGRCVLQQLQILDALNDHIKQLEDRILDRIQTTPTSQRVQTVPGPAKVLAIVIDRELGSIDRFSAAKHFTSYCGLVPKLSASAGRAHYGRMVKQCNTYLKWAFRAAPRSAAEGHRSRQRHRRSPRPPQLAAQLRRVLELTCFRGRSSNCSRLWVPQDPSESLRKAKLLHLQSAKKPELYNQTRRGFKETDKYTHLALDERCRFVLELGQCVSRSSFARPFADTIRWGSPPTGKVFHTVWPLVGPHLVGLARWQVWRRASRRSQ
jgi:hypothetical protein